MRSKPTLALALSALTFATATAPAAAATGGLAAFAPAAHARPHSRRSRGRTPQASARLVAGRAYSPPGAPPAVRLLIAAGNDLRHKRYRYGGGHAGFLDQAYDCSGSVSYVLHAAGLLGAPLDSTSFEAWGLAGAGRWITVFASSGHAFLTVAGLRLDTAGAPGPRWQTLPRSTAGFARRHPAGL